MYSTCCMHSLYITVCMVCTVVPGTWYLGPNYQTCSHRLIRLYSFDPQSQLVKAIVSIKKTLAASLFSDKQGLGYQYTSNGDVYQRIFPIRPHCYYQCQLYRPQGEIWGGYASPKIKAIFKTQGRRLSGTVQKLRKGLLRGRKAKQYVFD